MLEPLLRCNLACAGCGKIQYPGHILKQNLTPEECFRAVDECGAPTVAIPGGEPLMHPQIHEIANGIIARKKYVYLCTNGLLLKEKLHLFTPSKYLSFSVHMDGDKAHHDMSVCKEGGYEIALSAIHEAVKRGFRVTTNTTLFDGADTKAVRGFFDDMMNSGVEGMMLSPGYSYEKAPDQQHFSGRDTSRAMFRKLLSNRRPNWRFNMSPLFLEFLMGKQSFECTPWGMPTYTVFGWQKPCYLMQDGYAESFQELVESTQWKNYGYESGNPKCANCMVHSGYEASAVDYTFGSLKGLWATAKATFFPAYPDPAAMRELETEKPQSPLVQIDLGPDAPTLQGSAFKKGENIEAGLEQAFDYRGDVTIQLKDGGRLEGYIFDRVKGNTLQESKLRIMLSTDKRKVTVGYAEIEELAFSGRDWADGKSWKAWIQKYAERKAAGEENIELLPESPD
jgi:hopanoid biosynthesis associated radical SAM protein HpnH